MHAGLGTMHKCCEVGFLPGCQRAPAPPTGRVIETIVRPGSSLVPSHPPCCRVPVVPDSPGYLLECFCDYSNGDGASSCGGCCCSSCSQVPSLWTRVADRRNIFPASFSSVARSPSASHRLIPDTHIVAGAAAYSPGYPRKRIPAPAYVDAVVHAQHSSGRGEKQRSEPVQSLAFFLPLKQIFTVVRLLCCPGPCTRALLAFPANRVFNPFPLAVRLPTPTGRRISAPPSPLSFTFPPASLPPERSRCRLLHCVLWPGKALFLLVCVCAEGSILSPPEPPDSDAATTPAPTTYEHPQPVPKRKFHDAFLAPAPDAPIEPAESPAEPPQQPQQQQQQQEQQQQHSQQRSPGPGSAPADRLPNIRQPLPRSPPRPALAPVAGGPVRIAHGQSGPATINTATDDVSRSPVQTSMMAACPGSPGAIDTKKGVKRTPLRSSIACQRCRKSKIKCNNTGGDQPCETCIRNGKECTYPEATSAPPKRSEPPTGPKVDQGVERKRLRRIEDMVKMEAAVPAAAVAEEVLSAPYLTETVWGQLFDIYRLHFATELPFLHLATLKEKLGSRFRAKPSDTSPEINLVLLGILTLTARFHNTLVSYVTAHKNGPVAAASGGSKLRPGGGPASDAAAASEYYADVLTKALGGLRTSMTVASVERVQAFLMLGLYEWSQARPKVGGMAAWMYVGVAIRMAQALGLGDGDREPGKVFREPRPTGQHQQSMSPSQRIIAREIRRRTMFSCLILDRLLGCGRDRVSTIRSEDLRIQLPCSEVAFDLSEEVYTGFLKPLPGVDTSTQRISDSVLGRFVRLVDLWGEISRWSFAGGRFTEGSNPPWSPETTFFQLRRKLEAFYADLPDHFRWSDSNYYKHENHQASSVYVSLHMLGAVCRIMLHREYIPFIPILCDKPVGPLDEPTFPAGQEPEGFWEASAEEIFHAARDIVDLIEICRDKLPMSSLVLFAVWTAAFVGIYAVHFPHIDTKGHMLPKPDQVPGGELDVFKHGPTGLTYKILTHMSHWLNLAETYVSYFRQMTTYYDRVKQDYERHIGRRAPAGGSSGGDLSLRMGGGGLEEWKQQGFKVVNNGEILAIDEEKTSSRDSTAEPVSSVGPETSNSHAADHMKTPRSMSMSFTPINTTQPHASGASNQQPDEAAAEAAAASALWRFQQGGPSYQSHPQASPSQSSGAIPSPQFPQHPHPSTVAGCVVPKLPPYASNEVVVFLEQNQSMPWNLAPGGIDQFAHGTEELMPLDNGNVFWGGMPDAGGAWPAQPGSGMLQHVGGFSYC
ncbi:hypothetical protein VTJ04DRAFT_5471 [Mycothermus thermophilus]|uniref:uncharacterized protein n=1 Tax=Humicola insolens TaxID=85995 RepID=UPI0037440070